MLLRASVQGPKGHAHNVCVLTAELIIVFCVLGGQEDTNTELLSFFMNLFNERY